MPPTPDVYTVHVLGTIENFIFNQPGSFNLPTPTGKKYDSLFVDQLKGTLIIKAEHVPIDILLTSTPQTQSIVFDFYIISNKCLLHSVGTKSSRHSVITISVHVIQTSIARPEQQERIASIKFKISQSQPPSLSLASKIHNFMP
jgi:hypothetical protein